MFVLEVLQVAVTYRWHKADDGAWRARTGRGAA
jgi:hypothetical protein